MEMITQTRSSFLQRKWRNEIIRQLRHTIKKEQEIVAGTSNQFKMYMHDHAFIEESRRSLTYHIRELNRLIKE